MSVAVCFIDVDEVGLVTVYDAEVPPLDSLVEISGVSAGELSGEWTVSAIRWRITKGPSGAILTVFVTLIPVTP